jgi:hypothetical protein
MGRNGQSRLGLGLLRRPPTAPTPETSASKAGQEMLASYRGGDTGLTADRFVESLASFSSQIIFGRNRAGALEWLGCLIVSPVSSS